MKKIEATIKASELDDVTGTLVNRGVKDITVSEVRYVGREGGQAEFYRGVVHVTMLPRVKVEIVLSDDMTPDAISAISLAAKIGADGKNEIFVIPIDQVAWI